MSTSEPPVPATPEGPSTQSPPERPGSLLAFVIFLGLLLGLFAPVLRSGRLLASGDGTAFFYPAYRTTEALWDPNEFSGFPVVGDPEEMTWYPPAMILSRIPGTWNAYVISAFLLAMFLMYRFVRELAGAWAGMVAGLVYGLGGFAIWNLSMIPIVHALGWLPGILLGIERLRRAPSRRWIAWTAASGGCCLMAGHPQTSAYAGLVAAAYALLAVASRSGERLRVLRDLSAAGFLALLLSAVVWIPGEELARRCSRADMSLGYFEFFSFAPDRWTEFFLPDAPGTNNDPALQRAGWNDRDRDPWRLRTGMTYVGCLPLLLVPFAFGSRRRGVAWFAAAVVVVAAGLAMSGTIPHGDLVHRIPLLNRFRVPARHAFEMQFGLAMLAALGAARLRASPPSAATRALWIVVFSGVFLLALRAVARRAAEQGGDEAVRAFASTAGVQVALWLATCAVVAWGGHRRWLSWALPLVLVADLASHAWFGLWRESSPSPADFEMPEMVAPYRATLHEQAQRATTAVRLHRNRSTIPENRHRLWDLPGAHGYNPMCLQRYAEFYGYDSFGRVKRAVKDRHSRALDLLAVRYVFAPADWRQAIPGLERDPERWALVETGDGVRVYENRADPPRAWVVAQ
ncbi:MAG: YfhO family protein, partial [Gemmatimonadetes bacterium]|nr:YfhO family protein [Gemmatimonadota bacterium]